MTDTNDHVVIPYSRFLECLQRRHPIAAPPRREPPTSGADVPPPPDEPRDRILTAWRHR
jgi:hypothetical protein